MSTSTISTAIVLAVGALGFTAGRYTAPESPSQPAYVEVLQSGTTIENLAFRGAIAFCVPEGMENITMTGNTFTDAPPDKKSVPACSISFNKDVLGK